VGLAPERREMKEFGCCIQGCQIFLSTTYQDGKNIPNNHKIYKKAAKWTKWPQNRPKGHKIYIPTPSIESPSKIYPNLIFGLKISHLATLAATRKIERSR
jgi:hypothetical protein